MTTAAAPARRGPGRTPAGCHVGMSRFRLVPAGFRLPGTGAVDGDGEHGALTLLLAVLFVALLAFVGIIIDGGAQLDADQKANAIAQEAARAGAGMVNIPRAYSGGPFTVSPAQAVIAARQYLAAAGYPGSTVRMVGNDAIQVTVTIRQSTVVLSLIGIDSYTVHGTATAMLVSGVTGPGH